MVGIKPTDTQIRSINVQETLRKNTSSSLSLPGTCMNLDQHKIRNQISTPRTQSIRISWYQSQTNFTTFKLFDFHLCTLFVVDNVRFCHCLTFLFLVISYTTQRLLILDCQLQAVELSFSHPYPPLGTLTQSRRSKANPQRQIRLSIAGLKSPNYYSGHLQCLVY